MSVFYPIIGKTKSGKKWSSFQYAYLWVKCHTQNRKLEGSDFLFCKDIKLKMVADAERRRSSFMYVKESLSVNSSMF